MTTFAEHLRELRQGRRLTQRALADRAGLDLTTISKMEHGRVTPRRATVLALAVCLETDAESLLSAAGFSVVTPLRDMEMQVTTKSGEDQLAEVVQSGVLRAHIPLVNREPERTTLHPNPLIGRLIALWDDTSLRPEIRELLARELRLLVEWTEKHGR